MGKGEDTRTAILEAALAQASESGFEALTIGSLAERIGMSKSGLFAHFGSREDLQIAAIGLAAERYAEAVFRPAMSTARGLPRIEALFGNWLDWTLRSGLAHGCPMQAAAVEFDDRPGPVRDAVLAHYQRLEREMARAVELAVGEAHLRADLDVAQFVFDLLGVVYAYHHHARLLRHGDAGRRARTAFERLVAASTPASAA